MKSFKYLLTGIALLFALLSCDQTNSLPTKPEMKSDLSEIVFPREGGSQTIKVSTNRAYTATLLNESDAEWCRVSVSGGEKGESEITVRVDALDGDFRQTVLMLNASAAVSDIVIMQTGVPVLTTSEATAVDENSATLGMSWKYSGEISVAEAGISLTGGGVTTNHAIAEATAPGSYSLRLQDLSPETSYEVRAYLTTTDGQTYTGPTVTFTTDKAPVVARIASLREAAAAGASTVADNLLVEGVVSKVFPLTSTKAADITTARVLLQDGNNPGDVVAVSGVEGVKAGDRLSIRAKGAAMELSKSGALTLSSIIGEVKTLSSGNTLDPVVIAHTDMGLYENMFVAVEKTQLLMIYLDAASYPSWGSAPKFTLEVEGSTVSYDVFVPAVSGLATEAPGRGSGTVSGIVLADGSGCILMLEDAALTSARFESLLDLTFLKPVFSGMMTVGEDISGCAVEVPYKNGDNSVLAGELTVAVSGPGAEGITVETLSDVTVAAGNGSIRFAVSGTPAAEGEVVFTVNGITALTDNSCTAVVAAPFVPTVGNFNVYWIPTTANVPKNNIPDLLNCDENTNPSAVGVSALTLNASAANKSATKWSGDWGATGWDVNAGGAQVQYYETTLTVASGTTLALSGLDFAFRSASGDFDVNFLYSLNGGEFTSFFTCSTTEVSAGTVPLGKMDFFKAIPAGSVVTFRLVPYSTASAGKFGLAKDNKFAIYGNAQ